jgi:anti-anti-sigma factor
MTTTQPCPRWVEVKQIGRVVVVRFTTPLLVAEETIEAVGRQLFTLATQLGSGRLLLNCEGIEGLGSAMLGKLITLYKQLDSAGGKLAFCRVNPHLHEKIFEVHRLSKIFSVYEDELAALQALLE